MRFIHVADLHIDSPMRGLEAYAGAPVERLRGATRAAFDALIGLAIAEKVDFVLFCGDIYDRDWVDHHTALFLRAGLAKLAAAGIRGFIVRGNHDAQSVITRHLALPENVTTFASNAPQTVVLEDLGVAIHGQSFPNRAVSEDLARGYPKARADLYNIGLLHTSLTGRPGHDTYAPTTLGVLHECGYQYFGLGHVHAREVLSTEPWVVYPGNLQGRHANETGPKGCMLVNVEDGKTDIEFVALDTVRWSWLQIDTSQASRVEDLQALLQAALRPSLDGAQDRLHAVRVSLTGDSALHEVEARQPGTLAAHIQAFAQDVSDAQVWIEKVKLALRPKVSRAGLSGRQDAVGELARLVQSLAGSEDDLKQWAAQHLADLPTPLQPDATEEDPVRLSDPEDLRKLLMDAEATALARIGSQEAEGGSA